MSNRCGNIIVEENGDDLRVSNGKISLHFYKQDGGYVQEFYSVDRHGEYCLLLSSIHKQLIPWSEHRMPASPMISGDRIHLFGVSHDSLRMVYTSAQVIHHDEEKAIIILTGTVQNHNLDCRITLTKWTNYIRVAVQDKIDQYAASSPLIEYLMSSYAFLPDGKMIGVGKDIEHTWAPNLRPACDHIIGDCDFISPAIIVQDERYAASLIPDLDILAAYRPMPASLDLDMDNGLLPAPLLSYGFCNYESVNKNRYSRHDISHARRIKSNTLTYGFYLLLDADCARNSAYKYAARFTWKKFGKKTFAEEAHKGNKDPQHNTYFAVKRLMPNARTAFGLYFTGKKKNQQQLMTAAKTLVDELLRVPQDDGIFPTKYYRFAGEWKGCTLGPANAYYHTAECSAQLYWMLKWYQHVEQDPRIIKYCRKYARFIISSRMRSGEIPAWYTQEKQPLYPIQSGPQTTITALFLTELGKVTGIAKYVTEAERSAKYISENLSSAFIFQDDSLADRIDRYRIECTDPHTMMRPYGTMAMLWLAELYLELYKINQNKLHLENGLNMLDRLCLMQSVWKKPWTERDNEFGICVQSNTGCKPDAEVTAEFARCAMGYAEVTGTSEYGERASAAIKAALHESDTYTGATMRIGASAFLTHIDYGSAYIHIGKKWAITLNGYSIEKLSIAKNLISLNMIPIETSNIDSAVVFGGMRGRCYRVSINNVISTFTREEMSKGIGLHNLQIR